MTEVWFYVTEEPGARGRAKLLLRLLERAVQSKRQLYLHSADAAAAVRLDDWLWQEPASFLPHACAGQPEAARSPLILGHGPDPGEHHDMLINLDQSVPDFFSRFERVVELVAGDENDRATSRARWKFYRDRGYQVTKHELS